MILFKRQVQCYVGLYFGVLFRNPSSTQGCGSCICINWPKSLLCQAKYTYSSVKSIDIRSLSTANICLDNGIRLSIVTFVFTLDNLGNVLVIPSQKYVDEGILSLTVHSLLVYMNLKFISSWEVKHRAWWPGGTGQRFLDSFLCASWILGSGAVSSVS